MMKVALGDEMLDWDGLIERVLRDADLQKPHLQELGAELAEYARFIRELSIEKDHLEGQRQAVTQQLRITRAKGQEVATKLRAALKSHFGPHYEGLARFGIRPVRPRSRRVSEEVGIVHLPVPGGPVGSIPAPEGSGALPEEVAVSLEEVAAPPEET
jgi:hypothetical protein